MAFPTTGHVSCAVFLLSSSGRIQKGLLLRVEEEDLGKSLPRAWEMKGRVGKRWMDGEKQSPHLLRRGQGTEAATRRRQGWKVA